MFSALVILNFKDAQRAAVYSGDAAFRVSRPSPRPQFRMHWDRDSGNHLVSHWDRQDERVPVRHMT
jgi:hypothetical protein